MERAGSKNVISDTLKKHNVHGARPHVIHTKRLVLFRGARFDIENVSRERRGGWEGRVRGRRLGWRCAMCRRGFWPFVEECGTERYENKHSFVIETNKQTSTYPSSIHPSICLDEFVKC